jgi:tRNA-specific 2-thiouridylase
MSIAVAVSGGLDSLLALILLQERGSQVLAVHGRFLDADQSGAALERICRGLGVPFLELDLRSDFEERVIAPFVHAYLAGDTPNPCAACNPGMKFGLLFDAARERGAEFLATGHYVRLEQGRLLRGVDAAKDQSYFLSLVPLDRLERAVFPLGGLTKAAARAELARRGLTPPLSRESQEICFVPHDDYRAFLESRGLDLPGAGPVLLSDGRKIGQHRGLWRHTQGQRKGLGLSWPEPLYVLDKDPARNAVVVGPRSELAAWGCSVDRVNRLAPQDAWPETVLVQTRYRQKAKPARFAARGQGLALTFLEPQTRPTPGQIAALYTAEGQVLGGGIITAGQG